MGCDFLEISIYVCINYLRISLFVCVRDMECFLGTAETMVSVSCLHRRLSLVIPTGGLPYPGPGSSCTIGGGGKTDPRDWSAGDMIPARGRKISF